MKAFALIAVAAIAVSCGRGPDASGGADRELEAAIAEIEAGRATTPLVAQPARGSDATVTFLVRSLAGEVPRIVSDVTGWGESPDDSSFDLSVAPAARIEYLVVHGENDYRADPNNPRLAWTYGGDAVSELVTPDYLPPPELADPPVTAGGRTVEATIDSRALGRARRALVYLPPGYRSDGAYPVAVFHAGWGVAHDGQAPRILDWLITRRKIEPIVALFLESYLDGDDDNHEGPPMRAFLTEEAPAWLAARFSVTARADERAVLAISYGAKDALDAALAPAAAYGRLGLLIPGRRLTRTDLEAFTAQRDRRLRVAILAGRYDAANLPTALTAHQTLTAAGHAVDLIEVAEGHNPTTWRNHLGDVLASLFADSNVTSTSVRTSRSL